MDLFFEDRRLGVTLHWPSCTIGCSVSCSLEFWHWSVWLFRVSDSAKCRSDVLVRRVKGHFFISWDRGPGSALAIALTIAPYVLACARWFRRFWEAVFLHRLRRCRRWPTIGQSSAITYCKPAAPNWSVIGLQIPAALTSEFERTQTYHWIATSHSDRFLPHQSSFLRFTELSRIFGSNGGFFRWVGGDFVLDFVSFGEYVKYS